MFRKIRVVNGPVCQRHDFARLRVHHEHASTLGFQPAAGRLEFLFDDLLQTEVNRKADMRSVLRRTLGSTHRDEFATVGILAIKALPIETGEPLFH